jgi:hypothetical protein
MSNVYKIKTLVLEQLEKANEEMQDGKKISVRSIKVPFHRLLNQN